MDASPGLRAYVKAYIELESKANMIPQHAAEPVCSGQPLWPQVYMCMRCGDAAEVRQAAAVTYFK
jgi:hypothetical protein